MSYHEVSEEILIILLQCIFSVHFHVNNEKGIHLFLPVEFCVYI